MTSYTKLPASTARWLIGAQLKSLLLQERHGSSWVQSNIDIEGLGRIDLVGFIPIPAQGAQIWGLGLVVLPDEHDLVVLGRVRTVRKWIDDKPEEWLYRAPAVLVVAVHEPLMHLLAPKLTEAGATRVISYA